MAFPPATAAAGRAAAFVRAVNFGTEGYRGPCPLRGSGTHHYVFRLLAISQPRLDLARTATDADVLRAAQPYVIQQAELTGTYHR